MQQCLNAIKKGPTRLLKDPLPFCIFIAECDSELLDPSLVKQDSSLNSFLIFELGVKGVKLSGQAGLFGMITLDRTKVWFDFSSKHFMSCNCPFGVHFCKN